MKIYTKTGDLGETALLSGQRVKKNHPRLSVYGDIDELNSQVGLIRTLVPEDLSKINEFLEKIQHQLFTIGSHIACDKEQLRKSLPPIDQDFLSEMESCIDKMEASLPPLKNFILPGGSTVASHIHLARTITRRAERKIIDTEDSPPLILKILNRLSDYFFVLARFINQAKGKPDQIWKIKPSAKT